MVAPVVVFAIGNPSRGDDALGPELAARIAAAAPAGVEVVADFQLQIEHALDLEGRALAVFVDAGAGGAAPYELSDVGPAEDFRHTTHALSPAAVLATFVRCTGRRPPAARVLVVRGESFELGAPLSAAAARNLEAAWPCLSELCGAAAPPHAVPAASSGRSGGGTTSS